MASQDNPFTDAARTLGSIDIKPSPTDSSPSGGSTQGSAQSSHPSVTPRVRRRNRTIHSCLSCRARKLKCDKSHPCANCTRGHRDCVFLAPALDPASQLRLTEIKEKASSLESLLETDVARTSGDGTALSGERLLTPSQRASQLQEKDTDLAPSPYVTVDAVYEDDADDDALLDLGIQIGRMRLTERLGGFLRPKVAEELDAALRSPPQGTLLQDLESWRDQNQSYLMPGPAYIAPTAGFFFGQTTHVSALMDHLPTRQAADQLIEAYFVGVHPVAKILHRPSFEVEYQGFWNDVTQGIEPLASVQAIVFATMFSGLVSMDEEVILNLFGVHKSKFVDTIRIGTESALCRAHFLRTTKAETLQAFVMFLIPLCRGEISRMHSVLVGSAIRLAECMGLHRDGEVYGLNPVETHVRRLIWYQLCFLDIRTCEAQGPRPGVRKDDFDTLLPSNVNDSDLHAAAGPEIVKEGWSDTTLVRMRFEMNEFMRYLWTERPLLEQKKSTLTSVLTKLEAFQKRMSEKYDHVFDDRIPIQKLAKILKCLLLSRLHVMVLAPYHIAPAASSMAPRLRHVLIYNCVQLLEAGIMIETLSELHPWAFWSGAYHQSHSAFLLLIDATYFKTDEVMTKLKSRIWRCLDYAFETDPSEPIGRKSETILRELQEKTKAYYSLRKVRPPTAMVKHVEENRRRRVDGSLEPEAEQAEPPSNSSEGGDNSTARAIGKAQIPNASLGPSNAGPGLPAYGFRAEDHGNVGFATLASQLPKATGDELMPDIDWEVFDQLYPVGQNLDATPPDLQGSNNR